MNLAQQEVLIRFLLFSVIGASSDKYDKFDDDFLDIPEGNVWFRCYVPHERIVQSSVVDAIWECTIQ